MDRKDFIKSSLALCGMTILPAAFMESCSQASNSGPSNVNFTLDLTQAAYASLNTVGGFVVYSNVMVIRYSASTYYAFSGVCTHQGCQLSYDSGQVTIYCGCHGGTYNPTTGGVTGGPPPAGLAKYTVTKSGNLLTVKS